MCGGGRKIGKQGRGRDSRVRAHGRREWRLHDEGMDEAYCVGFCELCRPCVLDAWFLGWRMGWRGERESQNKIKDEGGGRGGWELGQGKRGLL
jgi:hypothetical protein